jgi:hypothetical protein
MAVTILLDGGNSVVSVLVSRFCRHNRLTAHCPICSKGTLLEPAARPARAPRRSSRTAGAKRASAPTASRLARGPFASAGPYEGGYEIRLERVPGGLRLAGWQAGQIARRAPVLAARDLAPLLRDAAGKELLEPPELGPAAVGGQGDGPAGDAEYGASPGRSGELRDELRVERLDGDRVRIARWILRPNAGWELQEAPVMLPPKRFVEALGAAARKGVLVSEPQA